MFLLRNTQDEIEEVKIEGFEHQIYDSTNLLSFFDNKHQPEYAIVVKFVQSGKIKIIEYKDYVSVNAKLDEDDFAVWCYKCEAFINYFSQMTHGMPMCNKCLTYDNSNEGEILIDKQKDVFKIYDAFVKMYIEMKNYQYYINHPDWREDNYNDGIFNLHEQNMINNQIKWENEANKKYLSYFASEYLGITITKLHCEFDN